MKFDMTTLGEAMIRLSVSPGDKLETATDFDVFTGGSESNTAVALSQLGMKTAWISCLADNPLGRRIESEISRHGVDTSAVKWKTSGRVGAYYVEFAVPPRATKVIYDRAHSAFAGMTPADVDWDCLLNTRMLHLTGITPALSAGCGKIVGEALKRARADRIPISFDVNYRTMLWPATAARKTLTPLMQNSAILIMTREDSEAIFKIKGDEETIVRDIRDKFKSRLSVLTLGKKGAIAFDGREIMREPGLSGVEVIDRLGAGDAFSAGLLFGFLHNDIKLGLKYGIAASAMKMGIRGDRFIGDREEIERVIGGSARDIRR